MNRYRQPIRDDKAKGRLYMFKLCTLDGEFLDTVKIGSSKNPKLRLEQLNDSWFDYGYKFEPYKVSPVLDIPVQIVERSIHNKLALHRSSGINGADGMSELFKLNATVDATVFIDHDFDITAEAEAPPAEPLAACNRPAFGNTPSTGSNVSKADAIAAVMAKKEAALEALKSKGK